MVAYVSENEAYASNMPSRLNVNRKGLDLVLLDINVLGS